MSQLKKVLVGKFAVLAMTLSMGVLVSEDGQAQTAAIEADMRIVSNQLSTALNYYFSHQNCQSAIAWQSVHAHSVATMKKYATVYTYPVDNEPYAFKYDSSYWYGSVLSSTNVNTLVTNVGRVRSNVAANIQRCSCSSVSAQTYMVGWKDIDYASSDACRGYTGSALARCKKSFAEQHKQKFGRAERRCL